MTSALGFAPCRNAEYGCDNYLIAQVSQDDGECRQCAAKHDRDMAYYGALYRKAKGQGPQTLPPTPEGPTESPSASAGHPGQPCPTCQLPDGSVNETWARNEGACCMCGSSVIPWGEWGAGMCSRCGDHSANRAECPDCSRVYEDWNEGRFEPAS